MTSRTRVLFRADAGPQIGLGHLQRCLSLAGALQSLDAACLFLTNQDTTLTGRVAHSGFQGSSLEAVDSWGSDDLAQTCSTATLSGCSAIVVDSGLSGTEYLSGLRSAGFFVCAIDDVAPYAFPCQLVVNGDVHARQLCYQSPCRDTRFLLGPQYSMLRPEFWDRPPPTTREHVGNVLVSLGGSDPYDLMPSILASLGKLPGPFDVTAIIGPFFHNLAQVEAAVQDTGRPVKLVHSPHSMRDLMVEADVAVSAGGQTLYELACVGCPVVAVGIASNQDLQLAAFAEAGTLRMVGSSLDSSVIVSIVEALVPLLSDPGIRQAMSSAGRRMVDGQGALRVATTIIQELDRSKD